MFKKFWKNGRSQAKNSEDLQNSGNVVKKEEEMEKVNNSKIKNIFYFISKIFWKNGRSQAKSSEDLVKTLEMLEEWKRPGEKRVSQS